MRKIKRFEPLSVMKMGAICYGALGVLEGAIFSVVFSVVPFPENAAHPLPAFFRVLFSGLSIVLFPVLFAFIGAVLGGIGAAVYNVAARFVGGIVVEVE
ncbi:MAG: hypothetical protein WBP79_15780 [Candidatus Acidiferrales bacterium]